MREANAAGKSKVIVVATLSIDSLGNRGECEDCPSPERRVAVTNPVLDFEILLKWWDWQVL
jgi:hypothetical protein